jgi:hypothetical protein
MARLQAFAATIDALLRGRACAACLTSRTTFEAAAVEDAIQRLLDLRIAARDTGVCPGCGRFVPVYRMTGPGTPAP